MALKKIVVEPFGEVTFQKRRGTRSIRIHIRGSSVRATLPHWIPYAQAVVFVKSRADWISENLRPTSIIAHGSYLGKKHQLVIEHQDVAKIQTRLIKEIVRITLPESIEVESANAQLKIAAAAERALKQESTELIAPRLHDLSTEHDITFKSVSFKKLQSRWGSCDRNKHIIINIFLVQLPWDLIDYVLIHELAHTIHPNHSTSFWRYVESCIPDYAPRRKRMKQYQPGVVIN